jgi:hypothetical protein
MTNPDNQSDLESIQSTPQIHSDHSSPTLTEQIRILTEELETSEVIRLREMINTSDRSNTETESI